MPPRRAYVRRARASQKENPPLRFTREWSHVTGLKTVVYPEGLVCEPEPDIRAAALADKAAVPDG
jgi:hypothetical protein